MLNYNFYNIIIFLKISLKKCSWSFCMGSLPSMTQIQYVFPQNCVADPICAAQTCVAAAEQYPSPLQAAP